MSRLPEEEPVYYREIHKNAYLKRVTSESCSKLRPLGNKKPALKPLWTLLCVHNGRIPYLEQYPSQESPSVSIHSPCWRASLLTARHVTASVKRRADDEHDFLIDTEQGPVRMMAPDWDSMQDWVSTLRNKLHELKIISKGENVYCVNAVLAGSSRAGFRDPTSPLPPTPLVPPDRVPGIEIIPTPIRQPAHEPETPTQEQSTNQDQSPSNQDQSLTNQDQSPTNQDQLLTNQDQPTEPEIDISDWNSTLEHPKPSTSQYNHESITNQSTKINQHPTNQELKLTKICGQNICLDDSILKRNLGDSQASDFFSDIDNKSDIVSDFKQTVVVNSDSENGASLGENDDSNTSISTNITVIQVSNKEPPHTAIPLMGEDIDVFSFEFKQNLTVNSNLEPEKFVNIVNTDENNGYGTIFKDRENDYGHISGAVTTNVSLTGPNVTVTDVNKDSVYERLCMASTSTKTAVENKKLNVEKPRKSSLPNLEINSNKNSPYEYLFPNTANSNSSVATQNNNNSTATSTNRNATQVRLNTTSERPEIRQNISVASPENRSNVNVVSTESLPENRVNLPAPANVTVNHQNLSRTMLNRSVERSHSQNVYDRRERERRDENSGPKRDGKTDKSEVCHGRGIWKRGLTELSLLTRLRSRGIRNETRDENERPPLPPTTIVVNRSRPEVRVDNTRRRSSSLNNGPDLIPLCVRAARSLRSDISRAATLPITVAARSPPLLVAYEHRLWVSWWNGCPGECRVGDGVTAVGGVVVRDISTAHRLFSTHRYHTIDILYQKIPLAKVYVLTKEKPDESLGIKVDSDCCLSSVSANSPAYRAGLNNLVGSYGITEVNNRPVNLLKNADLEVKRLSACGKDIMVILQPAGLVKKLRQSLKQNKSVFKKGL